LTTAEVINDSVLKLLTEMQLTTYDGTLFQNLI